RRGCARRRTGTRGRRAVAGGVHAAGADRGRTGPAGPGASAAVAPFGIPRRRVGTRRAAPGRPGVPPRPPARAPPRLAILTRIDQGKTRPRIGLFGRDSACLSLIDANEDRRCEVAQEACPRADKGDMYQTFRPLLDALKQRRADPEAVEKAAEEAERT